MQRDAAVGRVERLPARRAPPDRRRPRGRRARDVGDGVVHAIAAGRRLDVQRLVQVQRAGGSIVDELDVA